MNIIGQETLRERLGSMVRWNKLPKFIILVGEKGSGRRLISQWLAEETKADFCEVATGVAELREVIEQSYKLGSETLYLIPNGDKMSGAAKSALLKVTEEPPKYARFVMTVSDRAQVLDTLLSRACVLPMDSYTMAELMEFAGDDISNADIYTSCCNNAYEVEQVKGYGATTFSEFVDLAIDNIAEVAGCNALKMEQKLSFKDGEDGYDVKIFLQSFRTKCLKRLLDETDPVQERIYSSWAEITSDKLKDMNNASVNRQYVTDMWIFDIREAYNAEG